MNSCRLKLTPARLEKFIKAILESERHFLSAENMAFLTDLYEFSKCKVKEISTGSIYYRARINLENPDVLLPKEEMYPVPGLKSEGRANPYNVTVLYLANKPEIAVAEVRPGLFEPTTVATFVIKRNLKLVDFTSEEQDIHNPNPHIEDLDEETRTWIEINKCFSTSLSPGETRLNYIPTQIISEFFRFKGYDGVIYQSQFEMSETASDNIHENIALFEMSAAEATETKLFQIQKQIVTVREII